MAADLHPVKQETFDTAANINTDPKGFLREVDTFRVTDFGLYMGRGADHPEFGYLESWLLPELGLRANIFHFREGVEREQDFYSYRSRVLHTSPSTSPTSTSTVRCGAPATCTWTWCR